MPLLLGMLELGLGRDFATNPRACLFQSIREGERVPEEVATQPLGRRALASSV